jgi:hypothetical protein
VLVGPFSSRTGCNKTCRKTVQLGTPWD